MSTVETEEPKVLGLLPVVPGACKRHAAVAVQLVHHGKHPFSVLILFGHGVRLSVEAVRAGDPNVAAPVAQVGVPDGPAHQTG